MTCVKQQMEEYNYLSRKWTNKKKSIENKDDMAELRATGYFFYSFWAHRICNSILWRVAPRVRLAAGLHGWTVYWIGECLIKCIAPQRQRPGICRCETRFAVNRNVRFYAMWPKAKGEYASEAMRDNGGCKQALRHRSNHFWTHAIKAKP